MSESELQAAIEAILDSSEPVAWSWGTLAAYERNVARLCQSATLETIPLLLRITQEGVVRRNRGHSGLVNANTPLEFIPIRLRLARALKYLNNLPLPADKGGSNAPG